MTVTVEGGHIAEILEKSTGINPLWVPPWPSIEPSQHSFEKHPEYGGNSESKLLAGILGHNLCLDIFGAPSPEEFRGGLTVHGESSVVPYEIETRGESMICRTHLPLAMLDFERELKLEPGGWVRIRETVSNLLAMDRPIAWTQHVTLGPPFIEHGVTELQLPATKSMVYPIDLSEHQRYQPSAVFDWPMAPNKDGSQSDLRIYPAHERSAGVTAHLADPERLVPCVSPTHAARVRLCVVTRGFSVDLAVGGKSQPRFSAVERSRRDARSRIRRVAIRRRPPRYDRARIAIRHTNISLAAGEFDRYG